MLLSSFEKLICRPMFLWVMAFAAGVFTASRTVVASLGEGDTFLRAAPAAALIMLTTAGIMFLRERCSIKRFAVFAVVWLMMPVFAVFGYFRMREADRPGELTKYLTRGTDAKVTGLISFISLKEDGYSITLTDPEVRIGSDIVHPEKILVSAGTDREFEPSCGMRINITGRIYPFEKATNPGQFDAAAYYGKRHLEGRINASKIEILPYDSKGLEKFGFAIGQALYRLRIYLSKNVFGILPYPEASVLNSMLTGERGLLESEIKELYSEGGIAHILSISSLHLSLLGMGLFRLLLATTGRMRLSAAATILTMTAYTVLTGASVSTRRAVLMISIMLIGRMLGRSYDMLNGAGTAALIILAAEPRFLFDTGFLLSFSAVLGIYAASAVVRCWDIRYVIVRALIMSTSVQVFTLPVVLSTYYSLNPYSVVVNILILPLMSVLLVSGFVAALTGMRLPAGPVYYILRLYETICEGEKRLPYARVITGAPGSVQIMLYLLSVAIFMYLMVRKPYRAVKKAGKAQKRRNYALMPILMCCIVILLKWPSGGFDAAFLDVGQGDCIYFETDGRSFMYDSGSSNIKNVGKYRVIPFLKHRGVKRFEKLFISHTDKDHVSAVFEMIDAGYPVIEELVLGDNIDRDEELIAKAAEAGIPVRYCTAGEKFEYDGTTIRVVAPEAEKKYSDINSGSLVAEVLHGDFTMLLTGDSGFESEKLYLKQLADNGYSVLKCAHHGSKYSTSEELVAAVMPVLTVISCYRYNTYGHPSPATLERLSKSGTVIKTTPESGAVLIRVSDVMKVVEFGK